MISITSSLFLISKCSRITSFQSPIFQFLRIKRFAKFRSVYELFSCKEDNQGFLAFTYQVSPLAKNYDVPTLYALRMASREGGSVTNHSRLALYILPMTLGPRRLALQNKPDTNPSLFRGQI